MSISSAARSLVRLLKQRDIRVVFAESCTAGLVSASLARIPGVSQWLCGSAVTYREATKTSWLDVRPATLARYGVVSDPVARQMAIGVLQRTPEARFSAAITGHLGPDAPVDLDGIVFVAVARRVGKKVHCRAVDRHRLQSTTRLARQREAAELVLKRLAELL